jgi:hypothetical protein
LQDFKNVVDKEMYSLNLFTEYYKKFKRENPDSDLTGFETSLTERPTIFNNNKFSKGSSDDDSSSGSSDDDSSSGSSDDDSSSDSSDDKRLYSQLKTVLDFLKKHKLNLKKLVTGDLDLFILILIKYASSDSKTQIFLELKEYIETVDQKCLQLALDYPYLAASRTSYSKMIRLLKTYDSPFLKFLYPVKEGEESFESFLLNFNLDNSIRVDFNLFSDIDERVLTEKKYTKIKEYFQDAKAEVNPFALNMFFKYNNREKLTGDLKKMKSF